MIQARLAELSLEQFNIIKELYMEQKKKGTARISDEAVRQKTGKGWDEWTLILDEWDVKSWGHRMTARYLREFFGLSPWWARTVTNRHERLKGLKGSPI